MPQPFENDPFILIQVPSGWGRETQVRRLIAGCGYLGLRVARNWINVGDRVYGITRSAVRAGHFRELGLEPLVADVADLGTLPVLPEVDTLLWCVGFDRSGSPMQAVYVDGLRNLLSRLPEPVGRVIYISSTGVYGQTDGSWVDEMSECRPSRVGGRACLAAEQLLEQSPWASRSVILRLAGIYGPGRLPRLQTLRAGEPLDGDPDGWLNLIHVEDAAAIVGLVSERTLELPRVYAVADGHPVMRREFYAEVARLWQTPPAEFRTVSGGPQRDDRHGGGHKRVNTTRLQQELAPSLHYPTYRHGLTAMAAGPTH